MQLRPGLDDELDASSLLLHWTGHYKIAREPEAILAPAESEKRGGIDTCEFLDANCHSDLVIADSG
jgi:hypothetical protein